MMKHIKQGHNECKLATIAMLADISLDKVREIACQAVNVTSWANLYKNDERYFTAIAVVLGIIIVKGKVLIASDIVPLLNNMEAISTATAKKYLPGETLPLNGKGELFIGWVTNFAHSVAYENGIIFDPAQDKEYPFVEWMELPTIKNCIKYFIM